jgi:hypothetical protein
LSTKIEPLSHFLGVLDRRAVPKGYETLDDQLDDVAGDIEYLCDGGGDQ